MTMQKKVNLLVLWLVLLSSVYLVGWTYTWDCATPLGSDAPSTIDDRIRELKYAIAERFNVDHIASLTGTQVSDADSGYHRDIHFYSTTATDPVLDFTTVSGIDELRYTDSAGTAKTLTSNGTLNIVSSDLLGTLANNTYFTAVDAAGTGTVNLIKANTSNVAVVPDGSETATSAAPTADADLSNKKYVDDAINATVGAGTFSPLAYAGEESITLANGLIIKHGVSGSITANSDLTITFGAAFPTNCMTAVATNAAASGAAWAQIISTHTLTTDNFKIHSYGGSTTTARWVAIGY